MEDFNKQHAVETYKSLITMSVEGFKYLAAINGGAAIALLAYLGNVAGKGGAVASPVNVRIAMGAFLLGLLACGVAAVCGYLTQLKLFDESMGRSQPGRHMRLLFWGAGAYVTSLFAFAIGCVFAVFSLG